MPTIQQILATCDARTAKTIDQKIAALVDSSPATLDTLKELASAINNDAAFSTTITNAIADKVTKNNAITAGTGTKITYDAKGLVTGSSSLSGSDLPKATATTLGAIKIGNGLSIDSDGIVTATGLRKLVFSGNLGAGGAASMDIKAQLGINYVMDVGDGACSLYVKDTTTSQWLDASLVLTFSLGSQNITIINELSENIEFKCVYIY